MKLAHLLALAALITSAARGSVVHVEVNAAIFPGGNQNPKQQTYDLDFNGVNDITFQHETVVNNSSGLIITDEITSILGGAIGTFLFDLTAQHNSDIVGPASNFIAAGYLHRHLVTTNSVGEILDDRLIGDWQDGLAHVAGIRFDIGGTTHYGWMRCQSGDPGFLIDYAYESSADTPIVVPAPGALVGVMALLVGRRGRR